MKKLLLLTSVLALPFVSLLSVAPVYAEGTLKIVLGSKSAVEARVNTPNHCRYGDFELIADEVKGDVPRRQRNIIATIEVLGTKHKSYKPSSYILASIYQDADPLSLLDEISFTVPAVKETVLAGAFICKDSKNRSTCSHVPLQSFQEMLSAVGIRPSEFDPKTKRLTTEAMMRLKNPRPEIKDDHIYFFQPLLIHPDSIEVLPPLAHGQSYAKVLAARKDLSDQEAIRFAQKAHEMLGSYPLRIEEKKLVFDIPKYSKTTCSQDD